MQDDSQKNLLLAVGLSALVLLGWQLFFVNPKIKDERERKALQEVNKPLKAGETKDAKSPPVPGVATKSAGQAPVPAVSPAVSKSTSREGALALSARIPFETPGVKGSISLKGARIDDLRLERYDETTDRNSPKVALLSPTGSPEPYYAEFGWLAAPGVKAKLPNASTVWTSVGASKLTPSTPISLQWDNGEGLIFKRQISIDDNYMFTIKDDVTNNGSEPIVLDHRSVLSRHGLPELSGYYILHEGMIGVTNDSLQEVTYKSATKDLTAGQHLTKPFEKVSGGWFGITDKYWATALVPNQTDPHDIYVTGYAKNGNEPESYQIDYLKRGVTIAPQATAGAKMDLFAGAKKVNVIEAYGEKLGIHKFDLMIDWGWFYFITKPLFHVIDWLARMFANLGFTGNFGLAILLTTVLVKLLFFPLASKSYESMAKMKKLQPEMKRLQETYKDDKPRQQQELMALYKKEKINPMAGCLPMLLQIPVFFALYKVLFVTIDMRHAPFYGWIHDLSAPDPTTIFNLFGLLPFAPPHFLHIGAWPLIMGFTMFVQMKLNPQQPDPTQQMIFNWMPVVFTFMLASFPVGLVIYWAWNNVLSVIQQYYINKKNGAEVHLWKNLGLEKLQSLVTGKKSGSQS
ncbi:MAG: membrane protein insertase YidC [Hyphomicrobiaceae bacterium]